MSDTLKDGGTAFPHDGRDNGPGNIKGRPHDGMTLRDWFAGQALAGLLAAPTEPEEKTFAKVLKTYSRNAYRYADAMLAAREAPDAP